jgi:formamidopyrimidine-DNA glycosylase
MPELPEVETVRRGLETWCLERTITKIETLHHRATNPRSVAPLSELNGAKILKVSRRGKFLWLDLNRPYALVAHLGMSGQFRVQGSAIASEKHLRVRMTLDNKQELRYIDQRTFGWLALSQIDGDVPSLVSEIAPDIFEESFNRKLVKEKIRSKRSEIKRVLLDQSVMSGVGNIYADESLWRSKIHPATPCVEISTQKIESLLRAVESVMSKALVEGGTSFDSLYINVNGESGYFAHSLEAYGRKGEPCSRCGTPIERIVIAARSSHFCPHCQRS